MTEQEVKRNVSLYKWFVVLSEPLFIGPHLIFYLQKVAHMSITHIYIMEAIVVACLFFLEIPSGALADLIGRKKTIFLGSIFMLTSKILLATATSPIHVWISNIFWMLHVCLRSGADSAFLHDSLKKVGRENEYRDIEGKATARLFITIAFCSFPIGFLYEINPRIPFILSIPGVLVSCFLAAFFKEPPTAEKYSFKKQKELVKLSILFVKNSKEIMWIIILSALVGASLKISFFYYNDYFELVKIRPAYWGILFFLFNFFAAFFGHYTQTIAKRIGEKSSITGIILLIGIPIFIMGFFVSKAMISMIFLLNMVRGFEKPFIKNFINCRITKECSYRATILSVESAFSGLICPIVLTLFGTSLKIWPLSFSLEIFGCIAFLIGMFLIRHFLKILKTIKGPC